jgi:hypothetical protein
VGGPLRSARPHIPALLRELHHYERKRHEAREEADGERGDTQPWRQSEWIEGNDRRDRDAGADSSSGGGLPRA